MASLLSNWHQVGQALYNCKSGHCSSRENSVTLGFRCPRTHLSSVILRILDSKARCQALWAAVAGKTHKAQVALCITWLLCISFGGILYIHLCSMQRALKKNPWKMNLQDNSSAKAHEIHAYQGASKSLRKWALWTKSKIHLPFHSIFCPWIF